MSSIVRRMPLLSLTAVALFLSGCGGGDRATDTQPSTESQSSTTSSSATSSTSPPVSTTTSDSAAPVAPTEAATDDATSGVLVECVFGGGTWTENGRYSDGTIRYAPECAKKLADQLAANPYRCPGTDWQVPDLSMCNQGAAATPSAEQSGEPPVASAPQRSTDLQVPSGPPVDIPVETPVSPTR